MGTIWSNTSSLPPFSSKETMQSNWPVVLTLAVTLVSGTTGFSSPLLMPLSASEKACPAHMSNFELSEFLGEWYLLEYEFASENKLNRLDCLGFKFTLNDIDLASSSDVMISNFTFRFPPKTGFMYHVPTFATFDDDNTAKWNTNFKNVEMVSVVVDTDYSRWAVVVQCTKTTSGETFQSSRILSRTRTLSSPDLDRARAAIRDANVEGPFKYTIDQENCH